MARNLSKKTRREIRSRKLATGALVIATTDATQSNIRSVLGLQLLRLWLYDPRNCLSRLQADAARIRCEPLTYRGNDYTLLY